MIQIKPRINEYKVVFPQDPSVKQDATDEDHERARERQDFSSVLVEGAPPPTMFTLRRVPDRMRRRLYDLATRKDKHQIGMGEFAALAVKAAFVSADNLGPFKPQFSDDETLGGRGLSDESLAELAEICQPIIQFLGSCVIEHQTRTVPKS